MNSADRVLPVPVAVPVVYLVATDRPAGATAGPRPPLPPTSLLLARGATQEQAKQVATATYVTGVVEEAPLADALAVTTRARTRAHELAGVYDGLVVDAVVPRVVLPAVGTYRAATAWFVPAHADGAVRTHGLARFGLPELWANGLPPDRLAMYDAVLTGIAQRLIEEWPSRDPVGPATITLRDVARGYADPSAGGDDPTLTRSVDVTLSYDRDDHRLEVVLHDDPADALFG